MASRMFAVDLGAWSVKLAIASPGIRGATLLNVVERLVPPGDEPTETAREGGARRDDRRAPAQATRPATSASTATRCSPRCSSSGSRTCAAPSSTRPSAASSRASCRSISRTWSTRSSSLPQRAGGRRRCPHDAHARPRRGADRGHARADLRDAPRSRRAPDRARHSSAGFEPRGVLACGGAAVRLVAHTPSLAQARTEGAVAVIDIGHERTDVVVVADGKAVFSRSIARAGKQVTEAIAKHWKLPLDGRRAREAQRRLRRLAGRAGDLGGVGADPPGHDRRARSRSRATCARRSPRVARRPASRRSRRIVVGGGARLRGIGVVPDRAARRSRPGGSTQDDVVALAGPTLGAGAAAKLPIDTRRDDRRHGVRRRRWPPAVRSALGRARASKMDLSFLRAKAVPLGAAVLAIAAFAAGSAYADLYRLRKAEKVLATRLATESTRSSTASRSPPTTILRVDRPGRRRRDVAAAEDVGVRHPARDHAQGPAEGQDHARHRSSSTSTTRRSTCTGTTKTRRGASISSSPS